MGMVSLYSRSGYQQMVSVEIPTGVSITNIFVRTSTEDQPVVVKLLGKVGVLETAAVITTLTWILETL